MPEPITSVTGEQVLNLGEPVVQKMDDPVITWPTAANNTKTPIDFLGQYPQPLDTTEIIAMCEEVNLLKTIPEKSTGLKQELWRELNELAFTSGSNYIAFGDGLCPEEYYHDGDNSYVDLKNIGAKKSLTISDIIHSQAVASGGGGIRALLGGWNGSAGMPGGSDMATFQMENIANLKEKEIRLGMTLVLNGEDRLLARGDAGTRPLEFSGIEDLVTLVNGAHNNSLTGQDASGTFTAIGFDRWLGEGCAKPTHIFGHPTAIQEMMSAYFQLGFQGSQLLNFNSGASIVPGYSFAGFVQTGIGRLTVIADNNFTKTAAPNGTNTFSSNLYALRMSHNGMPLVYRATQIPLSLVDLNPGCTAISFEIWKKTALVIKAMCAQGLYTFQQFQGRAVTTCTAIG
jgi:hypothetical protein